MILGARTIALALGATAVAIAGVTAPSAQADGADAVIADLEDEGYLVRINWLGGFNTQQLSDCTVVRVNNPSSDPEPGDTVYVDVSCPNNLY